MGFRDVEWAYGLEGLAMREKVVLAAVCHRTLDKTHQTFVSQQTIAAMLGSSLAYVSRSLGALEDLGLITRTRRNGAGGYRTSDLITANVDSHAAVGLQGQEPSRPTAKKADSADLPDSQSSPTRLTAGAEENTQKNNQKNTQEGRATRIPDPFHVTAAMREWAAAEVPGVDVDRSTRTFVDYWRAESGSKAAKRDWVATWRNWLRRDADRGGGGPRRLTRDEENLAVVARIAAREAGENSFFDGMVLSPRSQQNLAVVAALEAKDGRQPHVVEERP